MPTRSIPKRPKDILPEEYLKAIGNLVTSWNSLEAELNMLLIHLLGKETIEARSHIVFTHMAFPQKLDILGALADEVEDDPKYLHAKDCGKTLIPLLKQAQTARNQFIHSDWSLTNGQVMRVTISARGKFKFSGVPVKIEEIERSIETIQQVNDTIFELVYPFVKADLGRWGRRNLGKIRKTASRRGTRR